jgi:hypothetical protein
MNLVLFAFATIGLTNILVHGKILDLIKFFGKSIREWLTYPKFLSELLGCYECTGFWSGIIVGSCFVENPKWYLYLLYGFAGSVLSQFYSELVFLLRSKTEFLIEDENESEKQS